MGSNEGLHQKNSGGWEAEGTEMVPNFGLRQEQLSCQEFTSPFSELSRSRHRDPRQELLVDQNVNEAIPLSLYIIASHRTAHDSYPSFLQTETVRFWGLWYWEKSSTVRLVRLVTSFRLKLQSRLLTLRPHKKRSRVRYRRALIERPY